MSMSNRDETTLSFSSTSVIDTENEVSDVVATLVVMCGEQVGRRYLIQERAIIGRTAQASVYIPDPQISRSHAEIVRDGTGSYLIVDMDSRNGTLVNGLAIKTHHLALGDQIQIGASVLLFTQRDPGVEQLLHRQKLEALGRIGAGIAHDFNNLLGAVMASLDYIGTLPRESQIGNSDVMECLADIRTASQRAADLSFRLLGFARHNTQAFGPVDLTGICEEVAHLSRRTFMRSIRVDAEISSGLVVAGDRVQLHQMLMNLCINARDAMPAGGTLSIRGSLCQDRAQGTTHVQVIITDSGQGMNERTKDRAFEPFYTTKSQGNKGSGLGLATVLEVVTAHGGNITLDTAISRGTTFTIVLPLGKPISLNTALPSTQRVAKPHGRSVTLGETGSVLLVEDEVILSRSTQRLLTQVGHRVHAVNNGADAVAWFERADPTPDLILLDMNMPGMSGADTYRAIKRISPTCKAIVYSGYWTPEEEAQLREEGILDFIQKPFDARQLRDSVARAMRQIRRAAMLQTQTMVRDP
jgi:two-component system cell cycle sensor histidine kinase/response regulator CckA